MSISRRDPGRSPAEAPSKSRWPLVGVLFFLTLGATLAARLAAEPERNPDPVAGGELHRRVSAEALTFTGRLDRGAVQVGGDGRVHLELVAKGADAEARAVLRRPTDFVVVLDRSGSMGGDPMAKAVAAIRELVGRLDAEDRLALVTYSNGSALEIPLERATPGARAGWLARLGALSAGGGTNMSAGLDHAHRLVSSSREAGRVARVILLSDGHANQGDASPSGLASRAGRAVGGEYVLSTVGVGEGFDERLMTRLADAGTGNFYYVPHVEVLAGIFSDEFDAARETVASALEIRIDTSTGIEVLEAAGYPLDVQPEHVIIRPGALYAGQERSFWVTLRVPAERAGSSELGAIELAYATPDGSRLRTRLPAFPAIAAVADDASFVASLDADAVQSHHAEEIVNRLRQSVSELVSSGRYAAASERLDAVGYDDLEALGIAVEDTTSFHEIEQLKDEVKRAASAPAAAQAEVRSQLGKSLYEAGTDGRRKGAKRAPSDR